MRLFCCTLVAACALGQEVDPFTLQWALAMNSRFREMHNPVVASYSTAELGSLVCRWDSAGAAGLFREALATMNTLPDRIFMGTDQVLPVSSFSGLWKFIDGRAQTCGVALPPLSDRIRSAISFERQRANEMLATARGVIDANPDRAAQLADAALAAGDPMTLDVAALTRFLSELRERTPDLSDDLFPKALDFIASAPSAPQWMELARYLFTATAYLDRPDKEQKNREFDIGGATIVDLSAIRHSTGADDVRLYIEAAIKALPGADATVAFAIVAQLESKASSVAPELVENLEKLLAQLRANAGANVAFLESGLSAAPPDPNASDAFRRGRALGRVLSAIAGRQFDEARRAARDIQDSAIEGQVANLIDFAAAGQALAAKDIELASRIASGLPGGVKRTLLYAGIIAAAGPR